MEIKPITIVGCGPGGIGFVPPIAREAIAAANVLVGAGRLLDSFPEPAAERIAVGANISLVLDEISTRLDRPPVVVLVTGDPGLCSLARPVIRRFGLDRCRVIPGISSVQAAFAALGSDWLGARVLSAHDSPPDTPFETLAAEDKLAVLAGNRLHLPWLESLVAALLPTHEIFACEDLTLPQESVRPIPSPHLNLVSRSILVFLKK